MMMNLDLVVTSDTSVAHWPAVLGVPVWVALPLVPDWPAARTRRQPLVSHHATIPPGAIARLAGDFSTDRGGVVRRTAWRRLG